TRLAVRLVGVPAAFISLVDVDRDFYKSACGFGEPLASVRELTGPTFCHYTVQRTDPLVIPDTAADPLYRDVPTVRTLGVAAYVGVPLIIDGQTVGAFCTIDTSPRDWSSDEVEILVELAASAQREMELRGAVSSARAAGAVLQRAYSELKELNERLEHQASDLEQSNDQLQQQAIELELQAEELQVTTTQLAERTEAAERANESKVTFLSMMSHELRTPLNAIGGYSELIAMGIRGPVTPDTIDYLSRIQRASRHLQTLIGDILDFAHLDAGRATYEIEDVPVNLVLDEAAELLGPQISEAGITFHQDNCIQPHGHAQCLVRADPKKLRQILVNLLTNAVKFTPLAGHVTLGAELRDDTLYIRVVDTGRGVPASDWTRIFEPFVQIDRTTTSASNQGVGLGLPISRQLAQGMNGDLTVTSEPGGGSTFILALPAA
ncbi:MAG TPA: GAF domain-containing sensor histidine kinase, partial [Gemmatimonadaceae bacterium]|nr:GAF domain-containing sensor histidine kinase [Gemmatimonadaceae bacterium]